MNFLTNTYLTVIEIKTSCKAHVANKISGKMGRSNLEMDFDLDSMKSFHSGCDEEGVFSLGALKLSLAFGACILEVINDVSGEVLDHFI